ncbi:hypothetical protein Tco_1504468 [Tanacetum coccineum]
MCGGAILSDIIVPSSANRSRRLTAADLLWNNNTDNNSYLSKAKRSDDDAFDGDDDFEADFQGFKDHHHDVTKPSSLAHLDTLKAGVQPLLSKRYSIVVFVVLEFNPLLLKRDGAWGDTVTLQATANATSNLIAFFHPPHLKSRTLAFPL